MKHVHSGDIERWLGAECAEHLSRSMRGWYGPPIALANTMGAVYVTGDGDFVGKLSAGRASSLLDLAADKARLFLRRLDGAIRRVRRNGKLHAGFSSLSDLISEATAGGKSQSLFWQKSNGTGTTVGNAICMRNVGTMPAARGTGGTSGTGVALVDSSGGAPVFTNPSGGDTTHITTIVAQSGSIQNAMLFDCLWDMTYNHASSTSTAIDSANRPTRYQTGATAPGNFISGEVTTNLSATAHNITVTYVDDQGNTAEAGPAYAAPASAGIQRTPTVAGQWFVPLNSPDMGVRYLTNIAQSTTASVTGVTTWFVGHPLAWVPQPSANQPWIYDGINSAFNLERVYDDAHLAWLCPGIATTGAWSFSAMLKMVSG